jgi:hypothetical protein
LFLNQASIQLSSFSPNLTTRARLKSSPLHHAGCAFLHSWTGFVEAVLSFKGDTIFACVNRINTSFDALFDALATLRFSLPIIRFRTDSACSALQQFQDDVLLLRSEISAVFLDPPETRFSRFDPLAFHRRITATMHSVSALFDRALPYACLPHAKTVLCRTRMCSSVAAISTAVEEAHASEGTFTALRAQLLFATEKLNCLFGQLRFPFSLSVSDTTATINYHSL